MAMPVSHLMESKAMKGAKAEAGECQWRES